MLPNAASLKSDMFLCGDEIVLKRHCICMVYIKEPFHKQFTYSVYTTYGTECTTVYKASKCSVTDHQSFSEKIKISYLLVTRYSPQRGPWYYLNDVHLAHYTPLPLWSAPGLDDLILDQLLIMICVPWSATVSDMFLDQQLLVICSLISYA
jgi:hypothetical protein